MSSHGNVFVHTANAQSFRIVQKTLHNNNTTLHTYNLLDERILKVVLRDVPTDISEDEIQDDLTNQGFEVKLFKRFGTCCDERNCL